MFTREGFMTAHSGVDPRFPRLRLEAIKHVAPPDPRISERLEFWIRDFEQTFKTGGG